MNTASAPYSQTMNHPYHGPGFFARTEAWLDERGRGAWIAAAVLGFIFIWPIGLAVLFYMIFAKGMFNGRTSCSSRKMRRSMHRSMNQSSGNSAFDAYRDDTLRRLEDEQKTFHDFLDRLRAAKDKAEFDQFMDDRAADARGNRDDDAQTA